MKEKNNGQEEMPGKKYNKEKANKVKKESKGG